LHDGSKRVVNEPFAVVDDLDPITAELGRIAVDWEAKHDARAVRRALLVLLQKLDGE
jgi:hypothetical protein